MYQVGSLLILSALVAVTWAYITRDMYNYNLGFGTVLGLNIFPVLSWTFGLAAMYLIATYVFDILNIRGAAARFALFTACYMTVVVVVETLGYHVLGVKNIGTSAYTGLVFCDCLHAPVWMQAGYFLLGPIYWLLYNGINSRSEALVTRLKRLRHV